MSEYKFVEKPFIDQLGALGWEIIDQGEGIPTDPAVSLRQDFRQFLLMDVFRQSVSDINRSPDGRAWLTDAQLDDLLDQLTRQQATKSLLEANEGVLKLLFRAQVDQNELTGEEGPNVKLIDFEHPERNRFLAINQLRIDTPGRVKDFIIPDIVLFVNGLPLIVIECKDVSQFTSNPMHEAVKQLRRYSNQREETHEAGLLEGEERLFHFNQLLIATDGDECKIGTITATEEYFYGWRDIFPEKYQKYTPPLRKEREQERLIQGVLPPETLLDIIRNCILFMEIGKQRVKIVARYQQYRAMTKIIERLRTGKTPPERSGVIWHTQGSGKSLTMVFVIRKLRRCDDLKDYKVLLVNDRIDLEEQLGQTAALTGEKVKYITSTDALKRRLASDTSDLNMVMIHKFQEEDSGKTPDYVAEVLSTYGKGSLVPQFQNFGVVNESERILIMIDEAHRSQGGDIGDNLFEAFPNATKLAFTGTPLIVDRHGEKRTARRFGGYIDTYKLHDAVEDGATVQILYEGKTADTAINEKHLFDTKFENLFRDRTEKEILLIKKKYGTTGDILEAEKRIEAIANDLVEHYITRILPNGFKAQVVSNSKLAAIRYKKYIDKAVEQYLARMRADATTDPDFIRMVEFLKSAVVVSSDGTNELAIITQARRHAREVNAVDNFKRRFDEAKPDTGIGFLIVCDMLLTGFDAPLEQVMYIDKRVKEHNLLQTIARVNRVAKGKQRGFIVDYIGLAHHLREALAIYASDDLPDIEDSMKDVRTEIPILEDRYRRLLNLFKDKGIQRIEDFVQQNIPNPVEEYGVLEDCVVLMADFRLRATFEVYLAKFLQSMDVILPDAAANPYKIPAKRFGYIFMRVRERYKDDSMNLGNVGEKISRLINEHLISLGINPKIEPVDLLAPEFIETLERSKTPKAKASEMEHAIRKHCKINLEKDPVLYQKFSEKLDRLIQKYKNDWEQLCIELGSLRHEVEQGRKSGDDGGMEAGDRPFFDLICHLAFGTQGCPENQREKVIELVKRTIDSLQDTIGIVNFWTRPVDVSALRGELSDIFLFSKIPEIEAQSEKIVSDIVALAKARHQELTGSHA